MIKSAIVAGLMPADVRAMIPRDVFLVFEGWNESQEGKKPGSDAPTADEYRKLVEKIDGGHG